VGYSPEEPGMLSLGDKEVKTLFLNLGLSPQKYCGILKNRESGHRSFSGNSVYLHADNDLADHIQRLNPENKGTLSYIPF
jgi:hypothetical protein